MLTDIQYRPMTINDVGKVPIDCQGEWEVVSDRITDIGSSAILAFDGSQHVGQLQFRKHSSSLKSPDGIWHPDYWGDFPEIQRDLPANTLGIFCYHVGQLSAGEERDEKYFGEGIGQALLNKLLTWASEQGFDAIVAKHTPALRPVMSFMGGQSAEVYEKWGFEVVTSWIDEQLLEATKERGFAKAAHKVEDVASVGMCVKYLI